MRSTYKAHNPDSVYFITSSIVNWINIFTSEKYYNIIIEALKFYIEKDKLTLYAFVIMKNHFHLICSAGELSKTLRLIKSYTAKRIIKELEKDNFELLNLFKEFKKEHKVFSNYQIWQEGFHPQEMVNEKILKQKIEYIHKNPLEAGYCEKEEDWKYSSARFYSDGSGSIIKLERLV